ncbi:MAG TPA: S28 family serine protease [Kofleriaceae bacterium]|nr:S28 family serine protease [Kofleriaceae bacterium]
MTGMRWLAIAALGVAACADDAAEPGLDPTALLTRLHALGFAGGRIDPPDDGHSAYSLTVTQPVDHDHPEAGVFEQRVTLRHRSTGPHTPMVVFTTGYDDYWGTAPSEPTELLDANQVSIEHRFFGTSLPPLDAAGRDWTKLTIAQAAADEHVIITLLAQVYGGPFITAGPSKGGMAAAFHRRFYPDDVIGTVAYVAPLSLGAPDPRYQAFLAAAGPAACHAKVHALAFEMLAHRRVALEALVSNALAGDPLPPGPALDDAVRYFEWAFWQYHGVAACDDLPEVGDSDDALFGVLDAVNSFAAAADPDQRARFAAYDFQARFQLGYPDEASHDLDPYLKFPDGVQPVALGPGAFEPTYDPGAMADIADFMIHDAAHMLFVYGQFDPWSAGAFPVTGGDVAELVVANGNHDAELSELGDRDRAAAFAMLEAWTGVAPDRGRVQERRRRAALSHRAPRIGRLP